MSRVVVPAAMLMKRSITGPVSGEPSGFFATGTVMVCRPARGITSPCQPLTTLTWPSAEGTGAPLPRFGTL